MPRTRTIPDARVFAAVQGLLDRGGDKAVSFSTVATATGLAPPTLVQRYGSRDGMVRATRSAAWDDLEVRTAKAIATTADKGAQGLLKAIGPVRAAAIAADLRNADLAQRAGVWRATVESALALRFGSGPKAKEAAGLIFAAWLDQALWFPNGERGFRLKDAVKRLS